MAVAAAAMRSAENRVSASAAEIIQATSSPPSAPVSPVASVLAPAYQNVHLAMSTADLVEGMVNLKQAELGFRESVAVFRAADAMTRRTLDILT